MTLNIQEILVLQNRVAYARDEQAYKKLFLHFYPSLFRFSNSILNNESIAEEVVSDVMMRIWEMEIKLAYIDKLGLYLMTSIKNASFNQLPKTEKKLVDIEVIDENDFTNENPESRYIYTELQSRTEKAIQNLPKQCQLIYRLIREEGLSYKEVIAILEISQNTIEAQMRIALKRLRQTLNAYLYPKK